MKFAQRLKELRIEKGLSLKQFEKTIQLDDSTLCRWENGQLDSICDNLIIIAKFYDVTVGYLLGVEEY